MKTKNITYTFLVTGTLVLFTLSQACGTGPSNANQKDDSSTKNDATQAAPNETTTTVTEQVRCFRGIDISHYNGDEATEIDPADSLTFIICKATQGTTTVDPDFSENWKTIKAKKMILGAYHFYLTYEDPVQQATHFLSTLNMLGETDMVPIVDIEQQSLDTNKPHKASETQKNFLLFLNHIESESGYTPMIYTAPAFANQYLADTIFSKYPLWIAEYTTATKPRIPVAWKKKGYKIWQKSATYKIHSRVTDYDIFYGKKSDLYK
jgi:GH25 family lysozyme M1 (1,4-beta-N-acetylmuramidase)